MTNNTIAVQISGSNLKVKKDIIGFVSTFSDERLKDNIICFGLIMVKNISYNCQKIVIYLLILLHF